MIAHSRHRKYANSRQYSAFKGGDIVGVFPVDWKMTDEQMNEFLTEVKEKTGADEIRLTWTSLRGKVDEKVDV